MAKSLAKRLSNHRSSNKQDIKMNMMNNDFQHVFDSINASSPIICFQKSTNIYHIDCEKLDINIESYFSTAHISYYGTWKNNTSYSIDAIFILPYYSNINIIQCTINSNDTIRTTSILKQKNILKSTNINDRNNSEETKTSFNFENNINNETEIKLNDSQSIYNNKNKNSWCAEEMGLFSHQIPGQFRVPIFDILPNQKINIKLKLIQSLYNDGSRGYRLRIPLQFYHAKYPKYNELIENNKNKSNSPSMKNEKQTRKQLEMTHSNSSIFKQNIDIISRVSNYGDGLYQNQNKKWSEFVTLNINVYYPSKFGKDLYYTYFYASCFLHKMYIYKPQKTHKTHTKKKKKKKKTKDVNPRYIVLPMILVNHKNLLIVFHLKM